MRRRITQADLFGWATAQEPVPRFEPEQVRAATLQGRIAHAIKLALAECGLDRSEVAKRMSAYLGERVPLNMLNAYASEAATDKAITLPRFLALVHATGDKRLLNLLVEPFDVIAVDRRCEAWIKAGKLAAAAREKASELQATDAEFAFALRMAKAGGK